MASQENFNSLRTTLKLHPLDNVIVCVKKLKKGKIIKDGKNQITLRENINEKHKFTTETIDAKSPIIMYGIIVGEATKQIRKGEAITTSNTIHRTDQYRLDNKRITHYWTPPKIDKWKHRTFMGYHREDGRVGTLNNWIVIPLVFCENRNILAIKEAMEKQLGYFNTCDNDYNLQALKDNYLKGASEDELLQEDIIIPKEKISSQRFFKNVDGLKFVTQNMGCGETRQDSYTLCRLIAGYITHPNVAGATILSLGCQNAQEEILKKDIKELCPNYNRPLYILEQQKSTSEKEFISEAIKKTFVGLTKANQTERSVASLDKITLGLECGGSDGFSGISANPTIGYCSDIMVALGGTAILSEFPELNGVEQELINRCTTKAAAGKFDQLMKAYNKSAIASGSGFESNPSPGNIKDGLITDAIKSAGAAKKGGTSPITQVLDYTEQSTNKGLNLLCTPGNDVESTTGLAASGANLILFSTGLGTPTGNIVTPVIKVSSNTSLFDRMNDIIDFNTGEIIEGTKEIEDCGNELMELLIEVASGKSETKASLLGQDDFIPWRRGISL